MHTYVRIENDLNKPYTLLAYSILFSSHKLSLLNIFVFKYQLLVRL